MFRYYTAHYFHKVLVLEMYISNQQPVAKINKQLSYNEYMSEYSSDFIFFFSTFMVSFHYRPI